MSDVKKSSVSAQILSGIKISAELATKHASLKKKTTIDLPAIHSEIGRLVFEKGLRQELLIEKIAKIEAFDKEIAEKKDVTPDVSSNATISDKVVNAAKATKERSSIELLLYKRKGAIEELGIAAAALDFDDPQFILLKKSQIGVSQEIEQIKSEIVILESKVGTLGKHPFIVGGAGLVIIILGFLWVTGGLDRRSEYEKQMEVVNKQQEQQRIISEKREQERDQARKIQQEKEKVARAKADEEYKIKQENERIAHENELKVASEKREVERQQIEAQHKAEREKQAADEKAEEEARVAAAKKKEAEEKAEEDRQQKIMQARAKEQQAAEQASRKKFADDAFGQLNLNPKIYLCKTLADLGVTAVIKGPQWEEIQSLHAKKDWINLVNLVVDQRYDDYPEVNVVESAINQIIRRDKLYVYLLFKEGAKFEVSYDHRLGFMSPTVGERLYSGEDIRHPDGVGYVIPWTPQMGSGIFMYNVNYADKFNGMFGPVQQERQALEKKVELGEIKQKEMVLRFNKLHADKWAEFIEWAKNQ